MDFGLSEEQALIVRTVRSFVERELYPLEDELLRSTGLIQYDRAHTLIHP